jgi:RNA polymerase sigma factor (sigma-70 family)
VRREGELTDARLLGAYVAGRDEAAFAALVRRHGPMVLGVCRRVLRNGHDAEDAFQATFLVLARKAASVRPAGAVGGWLYGVAYRAALKAREAAARRRERPLEAAQEPASEAAATHAQELAELLDREVSGLPEKYRLPVVLCDLGGKTGREAAGILGWPEGTVTGRLTRARRLLARRLARRGLAPALVPLPALVGGPARVPGPMVAATVQAAARFGVEHGAGTSPAAALAEGVMRSMQLTRLKPFAVAFLAGALLCGGAAVSARSLGFGGPRGGQEGQVPPAAPAPAKPDAKRAAPDAKLRAILEERLATLRAVAEHAEKLLQQSPNATFESLLQARLNVQRAEMDLCESDKERLAILEKHVTQCKEVEAISERLRKQGFLPPIDVLRAKAARLEADAALERARLQAAAPRK